MATIYQPLHLKPDNVALDMEEEQVFASVVNGERVTGYLLRIYSDVGDIVYEDNHTFNASDYYYNNETIEIIIPSNSGCVNGNQYSWSIRHYNLSESQLSYEVPFEASTTPVLTISVPATIITFAFDFVGSYSQSEGVALKYWYFILYDSNMKIVERTERSYSLDLLYQFAGLEDGNSYYIRGFGRTQNNLDFSSPLYTFEATHPYTALYIPLEINLNSLRSSTFMGVGEPLILSGEVSGGYDYTIFAYNSNK